MDKHSRVHAGVLRLSCPDRMGIVAGVSRFLLDHACNIVESAQFGDPLTQRFFMRVSFQSGRHDIAELRLAFVELATAFGMWWEIRDMAVKQRVLMMVSRFGHCLNDLLYRHRVGALPVEIPAIISNHRDFYQLAASHGIPFHYLPVLPENKPRRERQLLDIFEEERCDLVIPLHRYMQVLSPEFAATGSKVAPSISTHSFLPSFQGARPITAHDRGSNSRRHRALRYHADLDEGPIIEQDVARVDPRREPRGLREHGPRRRVCGAGSRGEVACRTSRAREWQSHRRLSLNRSNS